MINLYNCCQELVTWIGCVTLTIGLSLSNLPFIPETSRNSYFHMWDSYMEHPLVKRKKIIKDRNSSKNEDYLVRYYLLFKSSSGKYVRWIPINLFIHKFIKSDIPIHHNHPWSYYTYILKNGYIEHFIAPMECSENKDKIIEHEIIGHRKPGLILYNNSSHKHWIELYDDKPCWTLFLALTKKVDDWGFFPDYLSKLNKPQFISYKNYTY